MAVGAFRAKLLSWPAVVAFGAGNDSPTRICTARGLTASEVALLFETRAIHPVLVRSNKPDSVGTELLGVSITLGVIYTALLAFAIFMIGYGFFMSGCTTLAKPVMLQRVALGGLGLVRALYFFLVAGGVLIAGRPENLIVASLATPMVSCG